MSACRKKIPIIHAYVWIPFPPGHDKYRTPDKWQCQFFFPPPNFVYHLADPIAQPATCYTAVLLYSRSSTSVTGASDVGCDYCALQDTQRERESQPHNDFPPPTSPPPPSYPLSGQPLALFKRPPPSLPPSLSELYCVKQGKKWTGDGRFINGLASCYPFTWCWPWREDKSNSADLHWQKRCSMGLFILVFYINYCICERFVHKWNISMEAWPLHGENFPWRSV